MKFDPIAIVGQGCVLPGGLNAGELWTTVRDGRDSLAVNAVFDQVWAQTGQARRGADMAARSSAAVGFKEGEPRTTRKARTRGGEAGEGFQEKGTTENTESTDGWLRGQWSSASLVFFMSFVVRFRLRRDVGFKNGTTENTVGADVGLGGPVRGFRVVRG